MLMLNRSLLNREYTLINVLKALASIICMCNLHVTFLSKITPRYFIIQRKMRHMQSMTAREVDPLSLIFINFDIPALAPGLY
jgi:hypothetical protein